MRDVRCLHLADIPLLVTSYKSSLKIMGQPAFAVPFRMAIRITADRLIRRLRALIKTLDRYLGQTGNADNLMLLENLYLQTKFIGVA